MEVEKLCGGSSLLLWLCPALILLSLSVLRLLCLQELEGMVEAAVRKVPGAAAAVANAHRRREQQDTRSVHAVPAGVWLSVCAHACMGGIGSRVLGMLIST